MERWFINLPNKDLAYIKGEMGIIPGSMGVKSFIVRGLGNEESFAVAATAQGA